MFNYFIVATIASISGFGLAYLCHMLNENKYKSDAKYFANAIWDGWDFLLYDGSKGWGECIRDEVGYPEILNAVSEYVKE